MHNLNADPATLLKALFLAQLPLEVQRILAMSEKTDIWDLAREADRTTEVSKLTTATSEYRKPFRRHPVGKQSKDQKVNTRSDKTLTVPGYVQVPLEVW